MVRKKLIITGLNLFIIKIFPKIKLFLGNIIVPPIELFSKQSLTFLNKLNDLILKWLKI
tara:strand:+ start:83 stop:259 length:177 start_codon:yes stop_codon:yes gene_type:complete